MGIYWIVFLLLLVIEETTSAQDSIGRLLLALDCQSRFSLNSILLRVLLLTLSLDPFTRAFVAPV